MKKMINEKTFKNLTCYHFLGTLMKIFKNMGRNTSISLGNHFESFIEHSITDGRFNNAGEVIRAGLRLLEEEENRVITLRKAIKDGLDSGRAINFNPKKHLVSLKAKRKTNGKTLAETSK